MKMPETKAETATAGRLEQSRKVLQNILGSHNETVAKSNRALTSRDHASLSTRTSFKDGHGTLVLCDVNKLHSLSTSAPQPSPPPDATRYRANAVDELYSPLPSSPLLVRKITLPPLMSSHSSNPRSALLNLSDAAAFSLLSRQYLHTNAHAQTMHTSSLDMQGRMSLRERLLQRELRRSLTMTWPTPRTAAAKVRPRSNQKANNKHSSNSNYNSISNAGNINSSNINNTNNKLVSKDLEDVERARTSQEGTRAEGRGKQRIQIIYQRSPTTMITGPEAAAAMTSAALTDDKCWPVDKSSYLKQLEQQTLSGNEKTKLWLLTNPVEQMALVEPGFGERDPNANRRVMFTEQQ